MFIRFIAILLVKTIDSFKNWLLIFFVSLKYEWKNRRAHCMAGYVHVDFFSFVIHSTGYFT